MSAQLGNRNQHALRAVTPKEQKAVRAAAQTFRPNPEFDAERVLQELQAIVPDLPTVPVQPIILAMQEEPGMFDLYRHRPSFLTVHRYTSQEQLLADLGEKVIRPAELKVLELRRA